MLLEHVVWSLTHQALAHLSPCEPQCTKLFFHILVVCMNELLSVQNFGVQNRIIHSTNTGLSVLRERETYLGPAATDGDGSCIFSEAECSISYNKM